MLILILGFRSEYNGLDLHNSLGTGYFYFYDIINKDSFLEILQNFGKKKYANFEIGFVLFCKFIGTLCSNHQIMLFASALVSVVPVGYYIYKNSKNAWLSMMVYMALPFFGPAYFSAIRQGIAIGFVVYSYELIKRKKLIGFILVILLASTFHSSAIVTLVAYPMYHFRVDRESLMIGGLVILGAVFLLRIPLFLVLSRIVDEDAQMTVSSAVNLFLLLTLLYILCVAFKKQQDDNMRGSVNLFWIACAAQSFSGISNMAGRVAWYFMPVLIVLIPNLVVDMQIKEKVIRKPAICLVGILAGIIGLAVLRFDTIAAAYPYVPFWR
ncbi:MAG: EpsG family protein [Lachnospiraceae bacterium]|nr:EpsG family protein [Lachnospiraceae bacterium]